MTDKHKANTPNNSTRKLVAILFADIVGYTALMQRDESRARQLLDKFHETLNNKVTAHNGLVINDYGDGCLCTFHSAVDAVRCSMEVQRMFQTKPYVPVRIGLHMGDVFFEKDNVYGDSVNVTSRIESMGVAGAVLLSESIQKQISNQRDFDVQSLSSFQFKNVKKPMEVFALSNQGLVVPAKEDMKGKGQAVAKPKSKARIPILVGVLLVGIVGAIIALLPKSDNAKAEQLITGDILEQRVAVVPFENRTGDSTLNILGVMSADWINQGLMDLEDIEVVSPFTIRANTKFLGTTIFAENTKAQNIITGNYYQNGNELTFKLELADAINGQVKIAFEDIVGAISDKEAIVTQIREKITGYWQAKDLVDDRRINAPNLAAYELYRKALVNPSTLASKKAADADTTFYLAAIEYLNINRAGFRGDTPEYIERLDRHYDQLTEYERRWFDGLKALYRGDGKVAYDQLNTLRKKYLYDYWLNHETAGLVSDYFSNPELVLEIQNELPLNPSASEVMGQYYNYRLGHTVRALSRLNKIDELKTFLKKHPPTNDINKFAYNFIQIRTVIAKQDQNLSKKLLEFINNEWGGIVLVTNYMYSSKIPEDVRTATIQFRDYLSQIENSYFPIPFSSFEDTDDIAQTLIALEIDLTKNECLFYSMLFYDAAERSLSSNNQEGVQIAIDKLIELSQMDDRIGTSNITRAYALYSIGTIYAQMGVHRTALDYLKQAKDKGFFGLNLPYDRDIRLASLYDHSEFKELIKPIWPKVKG